MQIDIPTSEQEQLRQLARDAGFTDVEAFVTQYVRTLAHHPSTQNLHPLSDAEMQASRASCDRGMSEIENGAGVDAADALRDLGRKRGYASEK